MSFSSAFLFAVCLLVSFLYAGIEAGLLSLSRARLRSRIHQGDQAALRLGRLLAHPGRLLATVLLVTNFADVAALVLITNALYAFWGGWGCALAGLIMLPVYLILLQILPKSLFRRFPYRALVKLAGVMEITVAALRPLLAAGSWLLRRVARSPADAAPGTHRGIFAAVREDFKALAAEGERTGALSPAERGMIHNVIDFNAIPAREMTQPCPHIMQAGENTCVADVLAFARTHQLDIVPVRHGESQVALLETFSLLLDRDPARAVAVYLRRPALVIAPEERALRVLRRLRASRLRAATVFASDAEFIGIVRTMDLVQRLVRQSAAG